MQGKVCLITGANSGIGKATATGLAKMEAGVVLVCRDRRRGEKALADVRKRSGNENVFLLLADLSTRQAVHDLAAEFKNRFIRLDVLINNAGVLTRKRQLTAEGFERQFFVNHLVYFLLTNLLVDVLQSSAPARVVNVASTAHSRGTLDFEDLQGEKQYDGWQTYANTKLANIVFTYELARRLEGSGVTANCLHPGVIHTGLLRHYSRVLNALFFLFQKFFKNPDEGAKTPVYLASASEVEGVSGKYFRHNQTVGTSKESYDQETQRRLWEVSAKLTGIIPSI